MSDTEEVEIDHTILKDHVRKWITCDDYIRQCNKMLKKTKADKKEAEEMVLKLITTIDPDMEITLNNGYLKRKVKTTKKPLKDKIIQEALFELTKDYAKAKQMADYLLSKKQVVEKVNLQRTINKK